MRGAARWRHCCPCQPTQAAAAPAAAPFLHCASPAGPPAVLLLLQVISNRMQKSVLVAVDRLVKLKKYDKTIRRTTKLMVRGECVGRGGGGARRCM